VSSTRSGRNIDAPYRAGVGRRQNEQSIPRGEGRTAPSSGDRGGRIGAPWSSRTGLFGVVFCARRQLSQSRPGRVTVAGATAARLALRAVVVLRAVVEYPNSECGFEQRLAARDHAHGVHDVAAFDLFEHVAGRARQD
jgi:hypothetical protein